MPHLDKFLSALVTQGANALLLQADDCAQFDYAGTPRPVTKQPLTLAQLAALLKEIAPASEHAAIDAGSDTSFEYHSADGVFTARYGMSNGRAVASIHPGALEERQTREFRVVDPATAAAAASGAAPAAPAAAPGRVDIRVNADSEPSDGSYKEQIEALLRRLVKQGGSDLHLRVGEPPILRKDGEMRRLTDEPALDNQRLEVMLRTIMPERNRREFEELNDSDFAHEIEGIARFRCNALRDHHGAGAVFRVIPANVVTVEQLGLSDEVQQLCNLTRGLVLVTGPTGSGKSTTLCALVDRCNATRNDHVITIEDPIEFVHKNKKCVITQRQVGVHTSSFKHALRAALREDPDIVLVGELRDLETVSIAIETAETGHLVFGTLHTTSAASTIDRLIDQFPADGQEQIRVMLSESLKGVISQTLCKKIGGGRVAAREILLSTPSVSNLIREAKTFQLPSVIQTSKKLGMVTLNDALIDLVDAGQVEPQEAYFKANEKQGFANLLKQKGHDTSFLETELLAAAAAPAAPAGKR
ncbi:MAG TPA: type IV pilus twitching motility protein PilT [Gemmatimonadaceae bacterium]|nr:type IV pilus twitching motility protein PilT [Gemmatimonadaceae bacterium]